MIDTNLIKDDPQAVFKSLESRNYNFEIDLYKNLEATEKNSKPNRRPQKQNAIHCQKSMDCLKRR